MKTFSMIDVYVQYDAIQSIQIYGMKNPDHSLVYILLNETTSKCYLGHFSNPTRFP